MVINSQLLEDLRRGGRRDEAKQAVRAQERIWGEIVEQVVAIKLLINK